MKTIFISIITCTLILNGYAQNHGDWQILNEPGYLETISFINDQVGWVYGFNTFLKTDDGGRSWYSQSGNSALLAGNENLNFIIKALDFVNEKVGWIITRLYDPNIKITILQKTEDGGNTWDVIDSPFDLSVTDEGDYLISAVDDSTVYACRYDGHTNATRIIKTTDTGSTWQDVSPPKTDREYYSAWFKDTQCGLFIGSVIFKDGTAYWPGQGITLKTDNGGQSWKEKEIPEFEEIHDLQFINDSTCFFIGQQSDTSSIFDNYVLCKSTDTLNTWSKVYQDSALRSIESFFCLDETIIWAIIIHKTFNSILIKSTDGGVTWNKPNAHGWGGEGDKIIFTNTNAGFTTRSTIGWLGPGTCLYQTFDGGENWKFQLFNAIWGNFNGVCFSDKNNGFAFEGGIGFHGRFYGDLYETEDGGKWWRKVSDKPGVAILKCQFINQNTGFILSRDDPRGYIGRHYCFRSNDGGQTWPEANKIELSQDTTWYFRECNDMYFTSTEAGWAAGKLIWSEDSSGAGIFSTHDGGNNWELLWRIADTDAIDYSFNSISASNNVVWAVGEAGLIIKSIQPDSIIEIDANTDLPLKDVFFFDENIGWIAGGYMDQNLQSIVLKTNNGGKSWSEIRFDKYMIIDMFFADRLHGWAVGQDTSWQGMILESIDGGENWSPVFENLSGPLTAIHFKDGIGWATGERGHILRTEDGSTWIDQNTGQKYPSKYQLFQNYPNPFNSVTNIEYQISNPEHVELSIYDVLGHKVSTLVDKKQPAGKYNLEWNASGLASGLYYYRLKIDKAHLTRKLLLLK